MAPHGVKGPAFDYDIVHTNSELFDQDSDHNPQVVRLAIRGGKLGRPHPVNAGG